MSKLPETSRILLPSQGLVKSFLKPTWPTNADQDNLNIPAMDMEQRLNLILATGLSPGTRTIVNKNPFGVENTDRQGCQGARGRIVTFDLGGGDRRRPRSGPRTIPRNRQ